MAVDPTIYPALDALRAIAGILGLRKFRVVVRRRVWTGTPVGYRPPAPGVPGMSVASQTDTVLQNQGADGNLYPVRVRQLTRKEIFSSGGVYAARDLKVGPMTPTYLASILSAAGGYDDSSVNPMPGASPVELIWIVSSLDGTFGIPTGGVVCELKGEEATDMHTNIILRSTGRNPAA
jgi:hypothetical protein